MRKLENRPLAALMAALFCLLVMGPGCAGRQANPVPVYQYGDEQKTCPFLRAEIAEIKNDITRKLKACDNTRGKNVALGVAGAILFWPALFFMDLSDADQIELEALRKRHNALVRLSASKKCGFDFQEIHEVKPPTPEVKEKRGAELTQE